MEADLVDNDLMDLDYDHIYKRLEGRFCDKDGNLLSGIEAHKELERIVKQFKTFKSLTRIRSLTKNTGVMPEEYLEQCRIHHEKMEELARLED